MYEKNQKENIAVWPEFDDGVQDFISWAKNQHAHMNGDKIRCPYRRCKNHKFKTTDEVMYDICMKGFVDGYYNCTAHGEAQVLENYDDQPTPVCSERPVAPNMRTQWGDYEQMNWDQRMVYDTVRPQFFSTHPEPEAQGASSSFPAGVSSNDYHVSGLSKQFFDVVHAADQPLYSECDESPLAAVARLVNIKVEHNMCERCYD
ncbi:UNVERIFIED_CONTAM: hypothetical protein Sradi_3317100 [Sesamum radiatum]|uniref:Transposase-associated domain-containing protein n=1 Tax=Sesamum radiatum TaxID=300843 RepID=A0AAW2R2D0_SESRA